MTKRCVLILWCNTFGTLLRYDSKVTGTSTLNRYLNACKTAKKDESQSSMISFVNVQKVLLHLKQAIMEKFCCKDIRLFYMVNGEGFRGLALELTYLGATYGSQWNPSCHTSTQFLIFAPKWRKTKMPSYKRSKRPLSLETLA